MKYKNNCLKYISKCFRKLIFKALELSMANARVNLKKHFFGEEIVLLLKTVATSEK